MFFSELMIQIQKYWLCTFQKLSLLLFVTVSPCVSQAELTHDHPAELLKCWVSHAPHLVGQQFKLSCVPSLYIFKKDRKVKQTTSPGVVTQASNPSTWEAEAVDLCELDASLVHKRSSRLAWAVTQKPCLKKNH